jgi:hypothetical protein
MLERPLLSPRSGRCLIALLLLIKLVLIVWNAAVFDGRTYDAGYQSDRAVFGGLRPGKTAHDPPLYYLPALTVSPPDDVPRLARETVGEDDEPGQPHAEPPPRQSRAEKAFRVELLTRLRHTNVLWLALFYGLWLFWSLPRLVQGFQPWFLASLLLLAVPAYQRLGAMSHPDNLFVALASVAIALWLYLRDRWQRQEPLPFWQLALFASSIGIMTYSRWLAIAPAAVLAVVCIVYAVRSAGGKLVLLVPRLLVLATLIGGLSASWFLQLRAASHEPGRQYAASYFPKLERDHTGFNYARYYSSFHLQRLLDDERGSSADSFPTLVYSEIWGDEWLSFANPKSKDAKKWPTRVLLASAIAVPLTCIVLAVVMLVGLVERLKRVVADASARSPTTMAELEGELVLLALTLLGAGLFVAWQAGPGLLPGDNSSVRFNSIAAVLPAGVALLFARPLRPLAFNLLTAYFLCLFVLAFPLTMYWPR